MANCLELKKITKARLKSAKTLMDSGDWHGAAYMLGYALECALKAATCKTLRLVSYPENTGKEKVDSFFMTHKFEQLLFVSGLDDLFSFRSPIPEVSSNWSQFTLAYPGDWPTMRYQINPAWDEAKVKGLYEMLTHDSHGLITIIGRKKRW